MMKYTFLLLILFKNISATAQVHVDLSAFNKKNGATILINKNILEACWPVNNSDKGKLELDLNNTAALFKSIRLSSNGKYKEIAKNLDPSFLLTIGKRDLVSQNGWNIFFDKVPLKPFQSYAAIIDKRAASVSSAGSRTVITISQITADRFSGDLQITLYKGSPLFNVAAVMSTGIDSTAVLFDAGLAGKSFEWEKITWSDTENKLQASNINHNDTAKNVAVKYRTIIGVGKEGSLAIFPAPHQYFYPLDEAFNLKFTWFGSNYRKMIPGYGIGIRQDVFGDKRYVPWFNAPPGTKQRFNFFCLLSTEKSGNILADVKRFTHNDSYKVLQGYKTMTSHFHNEFVMKNILAKKPVPDTPGFLKVFKSTGIDIVHLAEFHYTAHPKGPDDQRLLELKALFDMCEKYSDKEFLLLPGEEPNEFFGGHWLQFFPKPVYWIMSRKPDMPFVTGDPVYGKVYRISNKEEMLKLLEAEKGLAWTAHARTKGSTGFPDKYKNEEFFTSDRFFGAAWKAMPADLSQPRLGKRVLDLMDDMANWGLKKYIIGEADLFTIEPENEMYAHLNVNYLQMDKLPSYKEGWQPVLDVMQKGKFFVSTGEILIPSFTVNGSSSGSKIHLDNSGKAVIKIKADWTFPLQFAEIISGDGEKVYRQNLDLSSTEAFGKKDFVFIVNLKGRKWVRMEIWDTAVNGAFTQFVWIDN